MERTEHSKRDIVFEVQDGILESIGNIIDRMSELKGLSRDVMKNARDQATYNREFKDLQLQLKDMISGTFNGVSLFARYTESKGATETIFDIDGGQASNDHTIDVFTSADGEAGAKVKYSQGIGLVCPHLQLRGFNFTTRVC